MSQVNRSYQTLALVLAAFAARTACAVTALDPTKVTMIAAGAADAVSKFTPDPAAGGAVTSDRAGALLMFKVNSDLRRAYACTVTYVAPAGATLTVRANGALVGRVSLRATAGVTTSDVITLNLVKGGNAFSLTQESGGSLSIRSLSLTPAGGAATAPPPSTPDPVASAGEAPVLKNPGGEIYALTFEDRFRGRELDQTKWRPFGTEYPAFGPAHCVAGTAGCAKSEITLFGKTIDVSGVYNTLYSPDNVVPTGSGLILRGDNVPMNIPRVNDGPRALFTSGWIDTYGLFTQTYGFFEMRAKMPPGNGWWPAFWLMPQTRQWSHEIDIFEILTGVTGADRANTGPHSVHQGLLWNNARGNSGGWFKDPSLDVTTDFHTYGLLWKPESLTYFVDGAPVRTITAAAGAAIPQIPMYVIANLSVGGSWGGYPDQTTDFSRGMEIDYVRVYQYRGAPDYRGNATFPVLIDRVSPVVTTAAPGTRLSFDVGLRSDAATDGQWSLNYTLSSVTNDPGSLIKGRDRVGGTMKGLKLDAGPKSLRVDLNLPADYPRGTFYLRARVLNAASGAYNNGATVAVVDIK